MDEKLYSAYLEILKHELVPALGCTEPIAIAFTAAKARSILGKLPEHITVYLSGNMIKNVKSVIVPNSGGARGIEIAATLGCVGGDPDLQYEVLTTANEADIKRAHELVAAQFCKTCYQENKDNLYIRVEACCGADTASVTVEQEHTNITHIERCGEVLYDAAEKVVAGEAINKSLLNVRDILEFAQQVDLDDVRSMLERQISLNSAISDEGLNVQYGASVGKLMMSMEGETVDGRAAARAAAASDARMNGCSMPVVINSGSGNQGITISLPIYEYAQSWNKDRDEMLRALALANLISVHIKRHIGNLSAFCGAVSAACGTACGIALMDGCGYEEICDIITNTLCNIGGMVCDGAKSSCAAKIASAVKTALMSFHMAKSGKCFATGEGLVGRDIEETIQNIGRMGRNGMHDTDIEIINIMVGN